MNTVLLLLAFPAAVAGIMFWLERHAEEGWEDESGYHRGPESDSGIHR